MKGSDWCLLFGGTGAAALCPVLDMWLRPLPLTGQRKWHCEKPNESSKPKIILFLSLIFLPQQVSRRFGEEENASVGSRQMDTMVCLVCVQSLAHFVVKSTVILMVYCHFNYFYFSACKHHLYRNWDLGDEITFSCCSCFNHSGFPFVHICIFIEN